MYYRGAKAAICVFDVTNEESYERVMNWLKDLRNHADPNVVICIAGNKCDKGASFELSRCEEFARSIGAQFFETSALTGKNVDNLFQALSTRIFEVYHDKRKSVDTAVKKLDDKSAQAPASATASSGCC